MSDGAPQLRKYRTVINISWMSTPGYFKLRVGGAAFDIHYLPAADLPPEYRAALENEDEIWTFARTEIGADHPHEMTFTEWETDNISTRADIDALSDEILGKLPSE